jgi:hypothetical protein
VTEPEPFTQMALSWRQAYGGPGFAENPLGKGVKPGAGQKGKPHMLPNLQYPQETAHLPNIRMTPACFSPLDISWPQRFSKSGTYDSAWLQEDFPAYARDIDWTIFNIAPEDQWFSGHLQGNEPYLLENLHPQKPRIEGCLPGFHGALFHYPADPVRIGFRGGVDPTLDGLVFPSQGAGGIDPPRPV